MMSCYGIEKILGWLQRSISFSFFIIFWVYIYFKMQCRMQCCIQMYFGTIWMVWVPKKVLATLFPDIFHVKTKWNIVYKFLKTKIFSRHKNILSQMHWKSNIFGHSASTNGGFWVPINYPILNFKKTVCPTQVWMWHWNETWQVRHHYLVMVRPY